MANNAHKTGWEWLAMTNFIGHIENVLEISKKALELSLVPDGVSKFNGTIKVHWSNDIKVDTRYGGEPL